MLRRTAFATIGGLVTLARTLESARKTFRLNEVCGTHAKRQICVKDVDAEFSLNQELVFDLRFFPSTFRFGFPTATFGAKLTDSHNPSTTAVHHTTFVFMVAHVFTRVARLPLALAHRNYGFVAKLAVRDREVEHG